MLLVVPGGLGPAGHFAPEIAPLAPRRGVAISLRWLGESDAPETGYSLAEQALYITAVVAAARRPEVARRVQEIYSTEVFRVYTNADVIGIELGGAVKNVIALAAGVSDGLGFGYNTRAALITRGLAEITRLGVAMGADPATFAGLAGMGDLVLTCTGDLSRNRTVGMELGRGRKLNEILAGMTMVAEGVKTTLSAFQLSRRLGVEAPITEQMYLLLHEGKSARQVVVDLMTRDLKPEIY